MNALSTINRFIVRRSPEILIGMGIAGMITTTLFVVKATPKAIELIENEELRREMHGEPEMSPLDKAKATWKEYVPAVVVGVMSVACFVGANSVHTRRNLALASAFTLAETTIRDYRDKIVEVVGERKAREISEKVSYEKMKRGDDNKIIFTGDGDYLCFDAVSGRYFRSDIETVRKIINDINQRRISDMWIDLNDLYYELNLDVVSIGSVLGWDIDTPLEASFSTQLSPKGEPCLVIDYSVVAREGRM